MKTCIGHEDQIFTRELLTQHQPAASVQSFIRFPEFSHYVLGDRNNGFNICLFEHLEKTGLPFQESRYVVSVIFQKANQALNCFLDVEILTFS